jgi:ADP-heptose:LPS heptosyltransferase
MNAATIRFVDKWLGVPACAVLTVWRRLFDWRRPEGPIRRVLILKLVEQGATVIAYPALKAVADRVGRENIFFMVLEENRPILDMLDVVPRENVISVPKGGVITTFAGLIGGILRARREKIDAVVDFEFFARSSAVMAYLTGASRRVGYHSYHGDGPWRGDLMTHRLLYNPHLHAMYAFLLPVEALWRDPDQLPALDIDLQSLDTTLMRFSPSSEETEAVRRTLHQATGREHPRPLVLLNANASDLIPLRKWDGGRYAELAGRLLADDPNLFVAFTGSPSEAPPIEELVRQVSHPRCFSLAGKTTMRQLLVLYTLADVLVSNDSGPGHFAALTDIDILTLVGPETPKVWGVLGPRAHAVSLGLPCTPCVSIYNNRLSSCQNNICMQGITVEMVHEKVRHLLARRCQSSPA